MSLSLGGSNGMRGRRRYGAGNGTLSEINIVPLVDVVLVLLIIFMLTAHVMEFGMEINVPQVKNVQDTAEDFPVVNITRDGKIFLNDKAVNINQLSTQIAQRFKNPKAVYVRPDAAAIYETIAQVISTLGAAKIPIKLVAKPEDSSARRR